MDETKDFIVSELLSELKEENKRKDGQIKRLQKTIAVSFVIILLIIGGFLLYLNQYDFTSSDTLSIEKSAEGMFAMVDSDGNIVGYDGQVTEDGEGDLPSDSN